AGPPRRGGRGRAPRRRADRARHSARAGARPSRTRDGRGGHARTREARRGESRPRTGRPRVIAGARVGHATDPIGLTGVTVVLTDRPAVGGVEIRGWAAGVHGLEFLDPRHLVPVVDGVVLAGGSAFGLASIWGVMQWLEERGVGFRTHHTTVPHVAGALRYDLREGATRARPVPALADAA